MAPYERFVLDGVPRVGFYQGGPRPPADDTFAGSLTACLELLHTPLHLPHLGGDPWHEVHCCLMGMSGSAFKIVFHPCLDLASTSLAAGVPDLRTAIRRAVSRAGYRHEIVLRGDPEFDEASLLAKLDASLRAGHPALGIGIVGPPEFVVLAGIDGSALIGWSYFQNDPEFTVPTEENGMFRTENWINACQGMVFLGEKEPDRDPHAATLDALANGVEILRSRGEHGKPAGPAAYETWQRTLNDPRYWPEYDDEALERAHAYHWQTAGTLAEDRAWGAVFLRQAARLFPAKTAPLERAAACYDNIHDLVWAVWEFSGPFPSMQSGAPRFKDAGRRRRVATLVRIMAEQDAEAAEHISEALGP